MRDYTNTPLQLYSKDFTIKAVIDVYDSFVWTDVYCGYGDFELKIQSDIAKGYNIEIGDFIECFISQKVMIVEGMTLDYDNNNVITATYKGRSLESLLCRRILRKEDIPKVVPQYNSTQGDYVRAEIRSLWDSIKYILERCIVQNTADSSRAGLSDRNRGISLVGYTTVTDPVILEQNTPYVDLDGMTLYDYICSVLSYYGYGFSMSFNHLGVIGGNNSSISNRKILFSIYNGLKRTFTQIDNERIVFTTQDDSTFKMNTSIDMSNYGNTGVVIGPYKAIQVKDGDGNYQWVDSPSDRYVANVYNDISDLDRYEIYVDGTSVPNMEAEMSKPYPDTYVLSQMRFKGIQEVKKLMGGITSYEPTVDFDPYKIYGENYYLGDLVTVIDDFNNSATMRVSSYSHALDSGGYKGYPLFETPEPIGGYRVLEQTQNGTDILRNLEDDSAVRIPERNNVELFDDSDIT